jgi:hypothetical protein
MLLFLVIGLVLSLIVVGYGWAQVMTFPPPRSCNLDFGQEPRRLIPPERNARADAFNDALRAYASAEWMMCKSYFSDAMQGKRGLDMSPESHREFQKYLLDRDKAEQTLLQLAGVQCK